MLCVEAPNASRFSSKDDGARVGDGTGWRMYRQGYVASVGARVRRAIHECFDLIPMIEVGTAFAGFVQSICSKGHIPIDLTIQEDHPISCFDREPPGPKARAPFV